MRSSKDRSLWTLNLTCIILVAINQQLGKETNLQHTFDIVAVVHTMTDRFFEAAWGKSSHAPKLRVDVRAIVRPTARADRLAFLGVGAARGCSVKDLMYENSMQHTIMRG